ncbi:MAG: MotA/TolQ/ExbB proton channel family protein [Pseudomonadota bacterium]|nr:MotA/TolQ/ExbB proton channel family protein [Pseudomonadota bacterium]
MRRARKVEGLRDYRCLRACLVWILAAAFGLSLALRYLSLPDLGEGYLAELAGRVWDGLFLQAILTGLLGVLGYALAASAAARRMIRGRLSPPDRVTRGLAALCGLPGDAVARPAGWALFADHGAGHLAAPVRDAAAMFPAVGFLGTVVGVSIAIGGLEGVLAGGDSAILLAGLRTAFDTTFLGLVAALLLGLMSLGLAATERAAQAIRDAELAAAAARPGRAAPSAA